ncbi:tyrosine-type recombinase/integrase [Stenoxybacter acetivorans]|uniref:tyrosine-type recombinase/integrase n=1 Tax=Stenoxybacter acetivorans TaxID=422441 RepID=UPI001FE080CF|nr:tyrosine-type recombinase/integrase [Stenoxybacter acetivorans]
MPLGANYLEALRRYADYERQYSADVAAKIHEATTFEHVAKRYLKEVLPKKAPRTQRDNLNELKKLFEFFNAPAPAPLNEIRPLHIRQYLDWRAKDGGVVRANREVSLFSHIFNYAREWGYTDRENPCRGVKKNKETGRDVYVSDKVFWAVYGKAERHIQFVMLVAYLIGQRVADCLKIKVSDIHDDELWIVQNKVNAKVRIKIEGLLAEVLAQLLVERGTVIHDYLFINLGRVRHAGQPLSYEMLRGGMDRARAAARIDKQQFQFRDLRAKAATDKDEQLGIEAARTLLGHSNQMMTADYIRNRKGKLVAPTVVKIKVSNAI